MKKISILIPCYNEEKSLPLLYPELVKLMDANPAYAWVLLQKKKNFLYFHVQIHLTFHYQN